MELVTFIKFILYTLLLYGLWLFLSNFINTNKLKSRRHLRAAKEKKEYTNKLVQHIELLFLVVNRKSTHKQVKDLLALTGILFMTTFILGLVINQDIVFNLFIALLVASIPYTILWLRVKNYQLTVGMLFLENFHVIYAAYNKERKMHKALIESIGKIKQKELNKVLDILVTSMTVERTEEGFKKAEKIFSYTINNVFGYRFGKLLYREYLFGNRIDHPLKLLNDDIQERKNYLKQKETKLLDSYLLGISQPFILLFFGYLFYQFTTDKDFKQYFSQTENLYILSIILFANFVAVVIALLIKKSKKID